MIDFKNRKTPYLIGEVGINHNGDIQIAKRLIDACFACGWDCVKFQKRNPEVCIPEEMKKTFKKTPWGEMKYLDYKNKIEFGENEYRFIDSYCGDKPIDWTVSIWDMDSLNFMSQFDIPFIKIPSALLLNEELISAAAGWWDNIIISTGMSEMKDIEKAVEIILFNNSNPIVMHCNSSYPTPAEEQNLRVIELLNEHFNNEISIGYSGHETDLEPSVVAAVLGAKVIERHITISHNMWGTDQKASLEIMGMDILKKRIEDILISLGEKRKYITKSEIEIIKKLRG